MYRHDEHDQLRHDVMGPPHVKPPPFCNAGGGLWSTADDYLRFVRMLLGDGTIDGVRVLSPESVRLMRTDRLTDEQKRHNFLGSPYWVGRGFGLNLSVVTDPAKSTPLFGPGGVGTFSWPGAYGTWWQADPSADLILMYLIQYCPDLTVNAAAAVAGNPVLAKLRTAQPKFVRHTYQALGAAMRGTYTSTRHNVMDSPRLILPITASCRAMPTCCSHASTGDAERRPFPMRRPRIRDVGRYPAGAVRAAQHPPTAAATRAVTGCNDRHQLNVGRLPSGRWATRAASTAATVIGLTQRPAHRTALRVRNRLLHGQAVLGQRPDGRGTGRPDGRVWKRPGTSYRDDRATSATVEPGSTLVRPPAAVRVRAGGPAGPSRRYPTLGPDPQDSLLFARVLR